MAYEMTEHTGKQRKFWGREEEIVVKEIPTFRK